jgi:hypothetical protein
MANRISSPFTVLRFSCWHFSEAVENKAQSYVSQMDKYQQPDSTLTLTSDKRDKLADTLLHALLGFLGDLRILWQGQLHNTGHLTVDVSTCSCLPIIPPNLRGIIA